MSAVKDGSWTYTRKASKKRGVTLNPIVESVSGMRPPQEQALAWNQQHRPVLGSRPHTRAGFSGFEQKVPPLSLYGDAEVARVASRTGSHFSGTASSKRSQRSSATNPGEFKPKYKGPASVRCFPGLEFCCGQLH